MLHRGYVFYALVYNETVTSVGYFVGGRVMATTHLSPSGAEIKTCESDESCEILSCDVCLTEIPADLAQTFADLDYVHHFCGLDCLEKWREKNKAGT